MILVAAGALGAFLLVCALYGWYVGGRPPGWFEGKFLVGPLYAWGLLFAIVAGVVVLGGLIDLLRSIHRLQAMRASDWGSFAGALGICAVLVGHFWVPWGLMVVYAIAGWRQALWMH